MRCYFAEFCLIFWVFFFFMRWGLLAVVSTTEIWEETRIEHYIHNALKKRCGKWFCVCFNSGDRDCYLESNQVLHWSVWSNKETAVKYPFTWKSSRWAWETGNPKTILLLFKERHPKPEKNSSGLAGRQKTSTSWRKGCWCIRILLYHILMRLRGYVA